MRNKALAMLASSEPPPVVWALLCLPASASRLGWKRGETTYNGAFYVHKTGLQVRCRGIEVQDVRWWHVIVGRPTKKVTEKDVEEVLECFFPPSVMVLQLHLPQQKSDEDEAQGFIVHLWWAVDGKAGVPDPQHWEDEAAIAPEARPATFEEGD